MRIAETERLWLRRIDIGDADFILRLVNEPSFHRFIGDRGVRTLDDARAYIESRFLEQFERLGFSPYAAVLRTTGELIGMVSLVKRDYLSEADIGYAFFPAHWSQGYACEATAAVMAYAGEQLGMKRLVAIADPDNERSLKLLARLGLTFDRMVTPPGESAPIELHATP